MKTLHITYKPEGRPKDKLKTVKTLFYILFFVAPLLLAAQTKTENYIKRTTYRAPSTEGITENDTLVSVTYFDGLGRPKQSVAVRAGGQGQDIVTPVVYDPYGRQTKEYLPYTAATENGNIHPDPMTEVADFYNTKYPGTPNPYSEKLLENSPFGRVRKQGTPGAAWMADPASDNDHSIKFSYDANTTGEVRLYRVSLGSGYVPTLEASGFYNPGTLYKTITRDENWQPGDGNLHTTEEFKDKRGRVVLKRTYADMPLDPGASHDTYYVYDKFSNLTFVIPPKVDTSDGVSPEELDELCYQYSYDHRNRLVEKKIPGKEKEYIVYNKLDQPVFTRDQHLTDQNKWLFSKHDKFGRVIYTGLYDSTDSREALQNTINGITGLYDTKTNSPTVIDGVDVYYDNSAFPNTNIEVLTINYYDTYTLDLDGGTPESSYGITPIVKPMMLSTGNKTRIMGTDQWVTSVIYYDKKGRPIYSYSRNDYLGVTDKVKSKLNFVGEVLETTAEHIKDGEASITAIEKFTYDPTGRILKHTHQIGGHPEETLAENVYDELGMLVQKKVGNTPATPLQTVDYSYNIRGWLTTINDVNNLGNDLFSFTIRYNDPEPGNSPLYNGNISQTLWRTANVDGSLKNYSYSYDALNRITGAIDNTGNYNLNSISYDKNGNILNLNRQGHINEEANLFGVMDNLVYTYDTGNKLLRVEDTANDTYGFKDDAVAVADDTDDYSYDDNGNMISDTNKGITAISYNYLNLPIQVTINGENILYIYDAAGIKQQKVADGTTTQYAGGYIYENSSLKFIPHSEGYIEPDGAGGYEYVYQYKDHLGNIRLSYSDANGDGIVDVSEIVEESNYYPFGLKHQGYNGQVNGTHHPYTYNGKEEQQEFDLNWIDYGARNYDAALGRWMSIDPLAEDYFDNSPYNYVANTPLIAYDPDGKRISIVGNEKYRNKVLFQLALLAATSKTGNKIVNEAISSKRTLVITDLPGFGNEYDNVGGKDYNVLAWDTNQASFLDADNGRNGEKLERNSSTGLAHELTHFNSPQKGLLLDDHGRSSTDKAGEVYAVEMENAVRKELGMDERTHYGGRRVYGMKIEATEYPGYYKMVRKKNYAEAAKSNYSDAEQSSIIGSMYMDKRMKNNVQRYYFLGQTIQSRAGKPKPNQESNKELILNGKYD